MNPIEYHHGCAKKWYSSDDERPFGYYFWDESYAYCYGPFEKRDQAVTALANYCETL